MTDPAQRDLELARHFQVAVNGALAEFQAADRPDLAREVTAEANRARAARPVVLVAGETKRGKSTLVNALARKSGLSPTGPDVATSTYIAIRHGERPAAREVADRLVLEPPRDDPMNPDRFFKLRIAADVPVGWTATERLILVGATAVRQFVAEGHPESVDGSLHRDSEWFTRRFPSPRYVETERNACLFLGGHEAKSVTLRDSFNNSYTRVLSGLVDGRGYRIIATLPWSERQGLRLLSEYKGLRVLDKSALLVLT